jgi:plasmid maintenance system antidote protein VapI
MKLRTLMAELDVRVGELADRAKVAPSTITEIKAGRRKATIETAYRIARALGVKVNDISEFKSL